MLKAREIVETLCSFEPHRAVGSPGNRAATDFFARTIAACGFAVEQPAFDCLEWTGRSATLRAGRRTFELLPAPYAAGCEVSARLVSACTVEELRALDARGTVLLLHGPIAAEQLMPKNFVFYNPEHHREIVALLEERRPAAIITATGRNPETAGAVYPFPMIEDGDFEIPVVYTTDTLGEELTGLVGQQVELVSDARRRPATGVNVVARRGASDGPRIVVCAHIDTKIGTPGALDNAAGTAVLLLLAERLRDYEGTPAVEIVALNGEENYAVPGQMLYLERNRASMGRIVVAVNLDAVGLRDGATCFSLYECSDELAATVRATLGAQPGLTEGEAWPQGDHMIFAMNGRPAIALTSERLTDILEQLAHTERDTPEQLDCGKLEGAADALAMLVAALGR